MTIKMQVSIDARHELNLISGGTGRDQDYTLGTVLQDILLDRTDGLYHPQGWINTPAVWKVRAEIKNLLSNPGKNPAVLQFRLNKLLVKGYKAVIKGIEAGLISRAVSPTVSGISIRPNGTLEPEVVIPRAGGERLYF